MDKKTESEKMKTKKNKGMSIIEVVIAILLITTILLHTLPIFSTVFGSEINIEDYHLAQFLALSNAEYLRICNNCFYEGGGPNFADNPGATASWPGNPSAIDNNPAPGFSVQISRTAPYKPDPPTDFNPANNNYTDKKPLPTAFEIKILKNNRKELLKDVVFLTGGVWGPRLSYTKSINVGQQDGNCLTEFIMGFFCGGFLAFGITASAGNLIGALFTGGLYGNYTQGQFGSVGSAFVVDSFSTIFSGQAFSPIVPTGNSSVWTDNPGAIVVNGRVMDTLPVKSINQLGGFKPSISPPVN